MYHKKLSYPSTLPTQFHELRKYWINKIFDFSDRLKLRNITVQTAIIYLDTLLSIGSYENLEKDKVLWSATALFLAAKYIEIDDNIPYIRELQKIIGSSSYTSEIFIKCEKVMLKAMDWDLMVVTPLNFTTCILSYSVLFGDDKVKITDSRGIETYHYVSNIKSQDLGIFKQAQGSFVEENTKDIKKESWQKQLEKVIESIRKYAEFFADVAVQSFDIQQYSYALQGIYSVLAARDVLGVQPVWNPQFDLFTSLHKSVIKSKIQEVGIISNFL